MTTPLQLLINNLQDVWPNEDITSLIQIIKQLLHGQGATVGSSTASLNFGHDNNFNNANIRIDNVAGGNIFDVTINFPQPINPQLLLLETYLYNHDSMTIFADRLQDFVGREAEIAEIRRYIAQLMPTGGYVTITAQAGEGKSSVIAQMVSQDGPDQTAFHFIALTPGREYQLSLLRPIVARLLLKHGLPTTYFPETSYPAMRDYFHVILRQLSERGIQEVIYIDGLDQLEAEAGGSRDLSFLPTSPPPGIVLVLGTRPDDTLQPLEGKKVQVEYRLPHLSYPDFQQLLDEQRIVTLAAQRLYDALQGNAFYLGLVVHELKAGPIADLDAFVEQISDNPDNLFGLTIDRLHRDENQWEKVLEPILGLFLVTQEPLDRATIRSLLGVSDVRLRYGLGQLGGLIAQDANKCYFLYHLKVRDYLSEDVKNPNKPCVVSQAQIISWHRRLASWCVRDAMDIERIWKDTTGLEQSRRWYARHHYITHLVLGKEYEQLWHVIDETTYGKHKQQFDPSTHLYALDLDRVRDVAVEHSDLVHLWRCSLLRVSLTSKVNQWPDELFMILIYLGQTIEALNRAELLVDEVRKVRTFCLLASLIKGEGASTIWRRAQLIAKKISDTRTRSKALEVLAIAQIQAGQVEAARETVAEIEDDAYRVIVFCSLAVAQVQTDYNEAIQNLHLAQSLSARLDEDRQALHTIDRTLKILALTKIEVRDWVSAQAIIENINDINERDTTLQALSLAKIEAGEWISVQVIIEDIININQRDIVLRALALTQMDSGEWKSAWATIAKIHSSYERNMILKTMVEKGVQAGELMLIHKLISQIDYLDERDMMLRVLAMIQAQSAKWEAAQKTITEINKIGNWEEILISLAQLQFQSGPENVIDLLKTSALKTSIIYGLIDLLNQAGEQKAAQSLVLAINDEQLKIDISNYLARKEVIELSDLAFAQAKAGNNEALMTIAAVRVAMNDIDDDLQQEQTLNTIDSALREIAKLYAQAGEWLSAREIIDDINGLVQRDRALEMLVMEQIQAASWISAQNTIDAIYSIDIKTSSMMKLAQDQAQQGYIKAVETFTVVQAMIARSMMDKTTYPEERATVLCALAVAQSRAGHGDLAKTFNTAMTTILHINDQERRLKALCALAGAQAQAGHIVAAQETLIAIQKIHDKYLVHGIKFPEAIMTQVQVNLWGVAPVNAQILNEALMTNKMNMVYDFSLDILIVKAMFQIHRREWDLTSSTISNIPDKTTQMVILCTLAAAQAQIDHYGIDDTFKRAERMLIEFPYESDQDSMLLLLTVAQIKAGRAETPKLTKTAWSIINKITSTQVKAKAILALHNALTHVGSIQMVQEGTAVIWRTARTVDELLIMAIVATPLISMTYDSYHKSDLGSAMVLAFDWVDEQLHINHPYSRMEQ